MARQNKCIVTVLVIFALIALLPTTVSAWIKANSSEDAFDGSVDINGTTASPQSRLSGPTGLARFIVQGAGNFLESHSNYLTFLNKYELSEIETVSEDELDLLLEQAVIAMERAEATYSQLKSLADVTPYNYNVYWRLVFFDYNAFLHNRGLNRDVFSRVAQYLGYGDVRGCYNQILNNCRDILARLNSIRETFTIGDKSNLNQIWRLSQKYSDSLLFGQYIAEIFFELKN